MNYEKRVCELEEDVQVILDYLKAKIVISKAYKTGVAEHADVYKKKVVKKDLLRAED